MSESDEDVTVDAEGVSIRKSLNDDQFETLAVVFDIRSGREHAAAVTLSESIPDGVEVDDIGFHPEYGGEHWRAEGDEVIFSRTFEPGEQYTTVYGVRDFDDDRASLLEEPALSVDESAAGGGIEDIDDLVSKEDSDVVREVISGDRDTLPSLDDEAADAVEEPPAEEAIAGVGEGPGGIEASAGDELEPISAEDEADEPETTEPVDEPAVADDVGDVDDEPAVAESAGEPALADDVADDSDVDELVEEPAPTDEEPAGAEPAGASAFSDDEASEEAEDVIEPVGGPTVGDDDVTADEEPALADEVGTTGVEDLLEDPDVPDEMEEPTVVDGMDDSEEEEPEEMVTGEPATDEEPEKPADEITVPVTGGIARVLAKELRAGNVSYEDRRLLREELLPADGSTDARIQRLQTQMADLSAYTDALEQFLDEEGGAEAVMDDLEARIDELAGDLGSVEKTVSRVDESVGAVEERVGGVEGDLDEVVADVDDVSGTAERLERDVESIGDDLDEVEALNSRLQAVEDDVAAIHDELAELATFRDRLSSVFGAGGGPGGAGAAGPGDDDSNDEGYGGY